MRLIPLCLIGLMTAAIATAAAPPAEAAGREATASKSSKAGHPARSASRQTASASRSASRPAAGNYRAVVARPGQLIAPGTRLRPQAKPPARQQVMASGSWQAGLPLASGTQRECPVGTISTLARGHDDVVRCLPL